jgi:hypothetical protein
VSAKFVQKLQKQRHAEKARKRNPRGEKPKEGWEMGKKINREGRQVVVPPVLAGRRR